MTWMIEDPFDTWTGKMLPGFKVYADYDPEKGGPIFRRFNKQPGKAFNAPEGKAFIDFIKGLGEEVDPLTPWLAKQFKNGRITLNPNLEAGEDGELRWSHQMGNPGEAPSLSFDPIWQAEPGEPGPTNGLFIKPELIRKWANWYNATDHPTRRGVNIEDKSFGTNEIQEATNEHREALKEEARAQKLKDEYGDTALKDPIHHEFGDGWTVRKLDTPDSARREGEMMDHCFSDYNDDMYPRAIESGEIEAYSLRDPEGWPHATWHYNVDDGSLAQVQGVSNHSLNEKYQGMFDEWADTYHKGTVPEGDNDYGEDAETEERTLDHHEVEIADFDQFKMFLNMSESLAEEWMLEDANSLVEAMNDEEQDENVEWVLDPHVEYDLSVYMRGIVSDFVSQLSGGPMASDPERAKVLWGTDDIGEIEGDPRQQKLDLPEGGGYGMYDPLTSEPHAWQKAHMERRDKQPDDEAILGLESLFNSAMAEGDILGEDISELIEEFTQEVLHFKPRTNGEGKGIAKAKEFVTGLRQNYTRMGEGEPSWETDGTLENQMKDPSRQPPLWVDQSQETGIAQTPDRGNQWQQTGELTGEPEKKQIPWQEGYTYPYGDWPSGYPSLEQEAEQKQAVSSARVPEMGRTAAMTTKQLLELSEDVEYKHGPDGSTVVKELEDGWTVRQPQTMADLYREGQLMGNCVGDACEAIDEETGEPLLPWHLWADTPAEGTFLSLRDPNNLPRGDARDDDEFPMGRHNTTLKPKHWNRWTEHDDSVGPFDPNIQVCNKCGHAKRNLNEDNLCADCADKTAKVGNFPTVPPSPSSELKQWLDTLSDPPKQPLSPYHDSEDDFTVPLSSPAQSVPHVNSPKFKPEPYVWHEDGKDEFPEMDRFATDEEEDEEDDYEKSKRLWYDEAWIKAPIQNDAAKEKDL